MICLHVVYDLKRSCVIFTKNNPSVLIKLLTFFLQVPGFIVGIKPDTLKDYEYPNGPAWQKLFDDGIFERE